MAVLAKDDGLAVASGIVVEIALNALLELKHDIARGIDYLDVVAARRLVG